MGRILAIDYGTKRVGLAVSDPLQIIASRLETVHSSKIMSYLKNYFQNEMVDTIVVGYPKKLNNEPTDATRHVNDFLKQLAKHFPEKPVHIIDERFTSKIAAMAMVSAGFKKSKRQDKSIIDAMSATIILQNYMEMNK